MASRKKLSTSVYLTAEQDVALKALSARTKVPVAVYVREGIDLFLRMTQTQETPTVPTALDEVAPRSVGLCPNPSHSEACCK